jgi:hypothetical protein
MRRACVLSVLVVCGADEAAAAYQVPAEYQGFPTRVGGFGGRMPDTQALDDELKNAGRQP